MVEKNQKRKDILKAAQVLFKDKGFHKTKMEEIAENAGVGKGTLYGYFSSKQDVFDATCINSLSMMIASMEGISKKNISFKDKLRELLNQKMETLESENITIEGVLSQRNIVSEKVVKVMVDSFTHMYTIIIDIINQGKEEGEIRQDISSEVIACTIVGVVSQFVRVMLSQKESNKKIDSYNEIFDLFFNGFGVK